MFESLKQLGTLLTKAEKRRIAFVFLIMLVSAGLEVIGVASLMPLIMVLSKPEVIFSNYYLNSFYNFTNSSSITEFNIIFSLFVLSIGLASIAVRGLNMYHINKTAYMFLHSISSRIVGLYFKQKYDFFLHENTANISKIVLSEIELVIKNIILPMMRFSSNTINSIFISVFLLYISLKISAFSVLIIGAGIISIYYFIRPKIEKTGRDRLDANTARFITLNEAFGGIKELRILGKEDTYRTQFSDAARKYSQSRIAVNLMSSVPMLFLQGLILCGGVLIILYLIQVSGSLNAALPTLAVFTFGAYRLLPFVRSLFVDASIIRHSKPALDTVHWDITNKMTYLIDDTLKEAPALTAGSNIELKKLSYSYYGAETVALKNISMRIDVGSSVGIVGRSGAGKSTLVDVLLGLLTPTKGQICIDGSPLTERDVRRWQKGLGYVPQSIFLSDNTIAANIAFGVPADQIDKDALELAAKRAQLHDFIVGEMPDGYDTVVGERGIRLSGGQRQRVAIARALYRKPGILVFDEATSALDSATEAAILATLDSLQGSVTVIMIAHRLSTVKNCDRIYVLEKGKIAGQGNYEYLKSHSKKFKELLRPVVMPIEANQKSELLTRDILEHN